MALTNAFHEAVKSGNITRLRIMMSDSLLVDPTFREFEGMERASQSVEGLYDPHDGREFKTIKNEWDEDYLNKLMVKVVGNFSHERIEHLKDVVRYLRPIKEVKQKSETTNKKQTRPSSNNKTLSYQEQKRKDQEDGRYLGAQMATGAVVGAAVGGVVAYTAGVTVVGGVAAGAVIGGVVVTVAQKGGS